MSNARGPYADPSNADASRAWNGDDGDYWAERDEWFDRSMARYHGRVLDAARITPDARVLDIGCGTGQTTRDAARRAPSGTALGVDLSTRMLEVASRRAHEAGIENARFELADAQIHPFERHAFDIAISRAGVMFFGDPVAAFTNIGHALRPGGRMTLLVWQTRAQNTWVVEFAEALASGRPVPTPPPDGPGPFSFARPARGRSVLTQAGFTDITFTGIEEPMWFGENARDAYQFVAGMGFTRFMLRDLVDDARTGALDALRATIEAHVTRDGVLYASAAWIVTARHG